MITNCPCCNGVMTICVSDMVCTCCGHSYRYRRSASRSVRLFNPPRNDFERDYNAKHGAEVAV